MPGRLKNERDARRLFKGKILGIGHAVYFRAANKFGAAAIDHVAQVCELTAAIVVAGKACSTFAARHAGSEHYFLANFNRRYIGTNLRDFSRYIASGNVR